VGGPVEGAKVGQEGHLEVAAEGPLEGWAR
jgi:hypothetical protein